MNYEAKLPRLLYISDVPVESSYHGSALLYRLLQDYPPEKLLILERWPNLSSPHRRLPGVTYKKIPSGMMRLLPTRLHYLYAPIFLILSWLDAWVLGWITRAHKSEGVLTVHHGYSWLSAARLARQQGISLHMILHDDTSGVKSSFSWFQAMYRQRSKEAYQQAVSRQCVSPFMVEEYQRRFGAVGTVLFPGRAKDSPTFSGVIDRLKLPHANLTVSFGGNIFSKGYADAVREMSEALALVGGRLLVFGPCRAEDANQWGLNRKNVEFRGLVSSVEMIHAFRAEADFIFIPMSFSAVDRANMEISFPSKLTDSTIPGVPILIYGPPYCSAVRWARENPEAAVVVDRQGVSFLRDALQSLRTEPEMRVILAEGVTRAGTKYFDYSKIRDQFFGCLKGA